MIWIVRTLRSSIGSKTAMAVTGLMLFGFVLAHLAGNLLVFAGPEALNTYGQGLQDLGPGLWVMRLGLLAVLAIHVFVATRLVARNRAARATPYACDATVQASFASRSMLLTGLSISAFVVFHLAHFTWRWIQSAATHDYVLKDGREVHDVYAMVVEGFQNPLLAAIYLLALAALFLHLRHGMSSFLQTLGFNHPRYQGIAKAFGPLIASAIVLGYLSIPLAILFRIVGPEA